MKLYNSLFFLSFLVFLITSCRCSSAGNSKSSSNVQESAPLGPESDSVEQPHIKTPGVLFTDDPPEGGGSPDRYQSNLQAGNDRAKYERSEGENNFAGFSWRAPSVPSKEETPFKYIPLHRVHPAIGHCTQDQFDFKRVVLLGSGGFGDVFRVPHKAVDTHFALKYLSLSEVNTNPERTMREESLMSRFSESSLRYVARYYCSVWLPENGLYMVQELLNGGDLAAYLKKHGRLSQREVARFTAQAIQALSHIHSKCIVHRDIKPANLMLHDGRLRLVDFGLAREDCDRQLTAFGGTHEYVAPTVFGDSSYGAEVDYYSLAVVVFELFMNDLPYRIPSGEKLGVTLNKFFQGDYDIPTTGNKRVDKLIDALLCTYRLEYEEKIESLSIFTSSDWD